MLLIIDNKDTIIIVMPKHFAEKSRRLSRVTCSSQCLKTSITLLVILAEILAAECVRNRPKEFSAYVLLVKFLQSHD